MCHGEQQLKTNKLIVRRYLDNSRIRLSNGSREALALVTPNLEERLTKGTLSKEFYDFFIGISNNSLVKVIRVLGFFLNLSQKKYSLPLSCQERHLNACLLLIRSSQKHFPPEISKKGVTNRKLMKSMGSSILGTVFWSQLSKPTYFPRCSQFWEKMRNS